MNIHLCHISGGTLKRGGRAHLFRTWALVWLWGPAPVGSRPPVPASVRLVLHCYSCTLLTAPPPPPWACPGNLTLGEATVTTTHQTRQGT